MPDDSILERFVETTPLTVMARMALEQALVPGWVDGLFEDQRERQYTRELLFSTVVELSSAVALGLQPSLHAAAQALFDGVVAWALRQTSANRARTDGRSHQGDLRASVTHG